MGASKSKLSKKQIDELSRITFFSEEEIKIWFAGFQKDCPTGKLSKSEFAEIYQSFFPNGDARVFAKFVFNVFDRNGDGSIEFSEFLQALSITSRGNVDEKLEWAFKLYDLDNSGGITKDEMLEIVQAIFSMLGEDDRFAQNSLSPELRVERIFSKMDVNGDGELSKEEFLNGAKNDKSICKALSLYDDLRRQIV
ncbi:unnamed protein product [Oikopleura dioica]|uniref:Neuronal calcium sensor 1 n=1 Tax=Oikopleura dioica TaxID=34765 RepID=E4XY70_OIKDI|nr:unnamed protein product [Oikopleura dioica]